MCVLSGGASDLARSGSFLFYTVLEGEACVPKAQRKFTSLLSHSSLIVGGRRDASADTWLLLL